LWDFNNPQQQSKILVGHTQAVTCVAIIKDTKLLVSADLDGIIKIWQLPTGEILNTWQGDLATIRSISIDRQDRNIVTGSVGGTVKIWCLKTGNLQATISGSHSVCFSSDRKTLITGNRNHQIKIWHKIYGNVDVDRDNLDESILTGKWWEVLGVRQNASKSEVKQVFDRLAKKYHPDRNNSPTAKINMQAINIAYREFKLDGRN
jgi:WD40 repeat protein